MEESDEEFEEQLRTAIAVSLADHSIVRLGKYMYHTCSDCSVIHEKTYHSVCVNLQVGDSDIAKDFFFWCREPSSPQVSLDGFQNALVAFQSTLFPPGRDEYNYVTVRRSHVWEDSKRLFKQGMSVDKLFKVGTKQLCLVLE